VDSEVLWVRLLVDFCVRIPTMWGAQTQAVVGIGPASETWHVARP
jgi:hypothetical protein